MVAKRTAPVQRGPADLAGVDVNLLVALDALLEERNVTRAARRLRMGQPGLSHTLGRLRAHFEDPLLVRSGREMVLTPRARALAGPVRDVVERAGRIFAAKTPFTPQTARRTFRLAATDHVGFLMLPKLVPRLAAEAPAVDLHLRPVSDDAVPDLLAAGAIDCAAGVFDVLPAGFQQERLFVERFCCVVRADHPAAGKRLSLRRYAELPHLLIAPRGTPGGTVDTALAAHGLSRRVAVAVPHFLLAPAVLAGSDCVVTMSERLARRLAPLGSLCLFPPPLALPTYSIRLIWHDKDQNDDAHRWFRKLVWESAAELRKELPRA